jgi:muramoyltetrapeptide carboxypeptidase
VDRALLHLLQAGKLAGVRGFLLGDFPGCEPLQPPGRLPPAEREPTVRDVLLRVLAPLGAPIVWSAPVGHTGRPMLTLPLGVRVRLTASGSGRLNVLEPAVVSA